LETVKGWKVLILWVGRSLSPQWREKPIAARVNHTGIDYMKAEFKNLKQLLERLDGTVKPLDDHDVHDAIAANLKEGRDAGETPTPEAIAEWAAFMFAPAYRSKEGGWDSYYGPMWGGKTEDGKDAHTPDIRQFDSETFEYWAGRAREAKHPVLKVRYADLCWEFQKRFGGVAPGIDMAQIVIDSTMDAASGKLVKHGVNGMIKLARALTIAQAIGDSTRVEAVRDAVVSYEDAAADDDARSLWGFSYDLILEDKRVPKSAELEAKIIADLESRLARLVAVGEGKPVDPWGAESAAIRLAKYYRRNGKHDDKRRVLLAYGMTFERLAHGASGMLAMGWMRAVHDRYREFELRNEAEALLLQISESGKRSHDEMVPYSQKMEVSKKEMDEFLDHIARGTLAETLNRIAFEFLPDKQQSVDRVNALRQSAPLMSMLPLCITDHEGRPIARIGSVDSDLEGRVVRHISSNMQFSGMFLHLAIDRMREKLSPSVESIIDHLRQSPVFTEDALAMLRSGLQFYYLNDHIGAAHIIIPQVEASIRHLLRLRGGNFLKPHRGGGLMLKNLDDLLREDSVAKSLSENGVLYLRVLLTDQRGWNVRNDVCHGLLARGSFGRRVTDRLIHALLFLACVRTRSSTEPAA
jgi:hypothetical protein